MRGGRWGAGLRALERWTLSTASTGATRFPVGPSGAPPCAIAVCCATLSPAANPSASRARAAGAWQARGAAGGGGTAEAVAGVVVVATARGLVAQAARWVLLERGRE